MIKDIFNQNPENQKPNVTKDQIIKLLAAGLLVGLAYNQRKLSAKIDLLYESQMTVFDNQINLSEGINFLHMNRNPEN